MDEPFSGTSKRTRVREYFKPTWWDAPRCGGSLQHLLPSPLHIAISLQRNLKRIRHGKPPCRDEKKRVKPRIVPQCCEAANARDGSPGSLYSARDVRVRSGAYSEYQSRGPRLSAPRKLPAQSAFPTERELNYFLAENTAVSGRDPSEDYPLRVLHSAARLA